VKSLVLAVAIFLGWSSVVWGAAVPGTLTTVQAVHALSIAEAKQAMPVAFQATVTYFRGYEHTLFVQDGNSAIYVKVATPLNLVPGDRVFVQGKTHADFSASVRSDKITFLRHGPRPRPVPATFDELIHGQRDCELVTSHAVVRAADLERRANLLSPGSPQVASIRLQMLTENGPIEAFVDSDDASMPADLLDAEVQITGVAGGSFDGKMQQVGVLLHVSSLADIKVLKRAAISSRALPVTPMDRILTGYRMNDLTQRVRVHGTITYYEPGRAVVLQDGVKSLWIATKTHSSGLRINDGADATGFPDVHSGFLTLDNGEIWDSNVQANNPPQPATWKQLATSKNVLDLVSIEGKVVTEVRETSQDQYVLSADGQLFTARLNHANNPPQPMKQIPLGSTVRVSGICILLDSNPFTGEVPFDILMRSSDDIVVVARPSMLNIRNLMIVLSIMLLAVIAVSVWGWTLNLKVRGQTGALATMAEFEQRRSSILEDINGSKPLAEILEEITGMVSTLLHGVPCWCEVLDGARLGNYPQKADRLRILHQEIPARSGPSFGTFFAAFDSNAPVSSSEMEALSAGVRLATLAMETRRLYSDLLRRSEFDLLTDIYNRFSLEKHLDALIEEARQNAAVFGLIYVDLDEFKQVNDLYGHHIGDLYLQEVTRRMKHQLRSRDLLARLGGDEFAILLPTVRNRAGIEEITLRLKHCFDDPFLLEGTTTRGSASFGIALYPEDGATGDRLLNVADAAMYTVKKETKLRGEAAAEEAYSAPASSRSA
jgi:diguanylate cyclase (GGDEF)-like protein